MYSLATLGIYLAITCVTYLVFATWSRRLRFDKAARLHGCKPVTTVASWDAILGVDNIINILKADAKGHRSEAYRDLHNKYGATFTMKMLGPVQLQTCNPENIQAICTTSFDDWGVGPMRGRIGAPFLDRGIFTEDGSFWKNALSLIKPTFTKSEISDLDNFEKHVARLLPLIPKDGSTFDLLPLVKRLFMDSATEFILGQSTNCLDAEIPLETYEFMKAFDRSLLGIALLVIFGPFRWPLYLDPGWKKAYTKVHAFVDQHVQRALAKPSNTDEEGTEYKKYVVLEEMAKVVRDPYQLRHQILNVSFPARDTAAIGFGDVMFKLARHPDEWEKLIAEVRAIDPNQPLTYAFIRSLKRTKAIVNETLRLHPASSRIGRMSLRDTILPKGGGLDGQSPIFVPKGQAAEMDLYSVQRDTTIWGPDADDFKPDRWNDGRPLWESKWQYEPFLGGIRMCPAQNQVLTQVSYLLIRFAQEFRVVENRDEILEYMERVSMTVESRNGTKIALRV